MPIYKPILVATLAIYCFHIASSNNETETKGIDWVPAARENIRQTTETFQTVLTGISEIDFKVDGLTGRLKTLSKLSSKIAGVMGVFGSILSIVLAFLPQQESAELKLMKAEFGKLTEKIDQVAQSVDDVKDLIKLQTHKTAYIGDENKIIYGFSRMQECRERLDNVVCSNRTDCRRKKIEVAEGYIASLNIREHVENILRGSIANGAFGTALLSLIQEQSKCHVPKINRFINRVFALIMKGMSVVMLHDLLVVPDYQYMEGVTRTNNMLRNLTSKKQDVEDSCLNDISYWMRLDVGKSKDKFTHESRDTNKIIVQTLTGKYPWVNWNVCTCKGDKSPVAGPTDSLYSQMVSSSKDKSVHVVALPTTDGEVKNLNAKLESWRNLLASLSTEDEIGENYIKVIQEKIRKDLELRGVVQSFAVLKGRDFFLGFYTYATEKNATMHLHSVSNDILHNGNFNFRKSRSTSFAFAVAFKLDTVECKKMCVKGTCKFLPYSTKMICRCPLGFSGDRCELSDHDTRQSSVISSLLTDTMKLPTFASVQHTLEDTRKFITVSLGNIETTISQIGSQIEERFKYLGELMSAKFEWFSLMTRYRQSIEDLKYFRILENRTSIDLETTFIGFDEYETNTVEEKEIAKHLLGPNGIRKWLYQLNFLIIGRRGDILDAHQPVVFMVMDRYKRRLCYHDYKAEVDRALQQLMLVQFQGYATWIWAYSVLDLDSTVIEKRYQQVVRDQHNYFRKNTCSANILHSTNLNNCSGAHGFYIHPSLPIRVVCEDGYFLDGKIIFGLDTCTR